MAVGDRGLPKTRSCHALEFANLPEFDMAVKFPAASIEGYPERRRGWSNGPISVVVLHRQVPCAWGGDRKRKGRWEARAFGVANSRHVLAPSGVMCAVCSGLSVVQFSASDGRRGFAIPRSCPQGRSQEPNHSGPPMPNHPSGSLHRAKMRNALVSQNRKGL